MRRSMHSGTHDWRQVLDSVLKRRYKGLCSKRRLLVWPLKILETGPILELDVKTSEDRILVYNSIREPDPYKRILSSLMTAPHPIDVPQKAGGLGPPAGTLKPRSPSSDTYVHWRQRSITSPSIPGRFPRCTGLQW